MNNKGFSLVEIMVVVAVIAVLTAAVSPQISGIISKAKIAAAKSETKSIGLGIMSYQTDKGYYPGRDIGYGSRYSYYYGDAEGLNAYLMAPGAFYLDKKIGQDPWKDGYYYHMYLLSNPNTDLVFYSIGPDKTDSSWTWSVFNSGAFAGDDIGIMLDEPS